MRTCAALMHLALLVAAPARSQVCKIAGVRGTEIVAVIGGSAAQLTNDGASKSLPVWSPDGKSIAFVKNGKSGQALANLVIIRSDRRQTVEFDIHPTVDGVPEAGMRFVERVRWIAPDRIAISGSVNPSLIETEIFDVRRGIKLRELFSNSEVAFSPDGSRTAYATGLQQFGSEDDRSTLVVDGAANPVFVSSSRTIGLLRGPQWSPDGKSVAALFGVLDRDGRRGAAPTILVRWRAGAVRVSAIKMKGDIGGGIALTDVGSVVAARAPKVPRSGACGCGPARAGSDGLDQANAWTPGCVRTDSAR